MHLPLLAEELEVGPEFTNNISLSPLELGMSWHGWCYFLEVSTSCDAVIIFNGSSYGRGGAQAPRASTLDMPLILLLTFFHSCTMYLASHNHYPPRNAQLCNVRVAALFF